MGELRSAKNLNVPVVVTPPADLEEANRRISQLAFLLDEAYRMLRDDLAAIEDRVTAVEGP